MIKLIAIDLDGTLLYKNMTITLENLEAIKEAQDKGIKVVVATGRPFLFTRPYMEILNFDTPYIMYNGGSIIYGDGTVLKETIMPQSQIMAAVELCEQHNTSYMLYGNDTVYYKPSKRVEFLKEMSLQMEEHLRAKFELITDYKTLIQEMDFGKVLIVEEDVEEYPVVYKRMQTLEETNDILQSSSFYIEIIPKGVSKAKALEVVASKYNIKQSEIMAIGDQENDVSMIKYAGIGVAMGNAIDEVKKQADYVTLTVKENGVAHAIKRFVLET